MWDPETYLCTNILRTCTYVPTARHVHGPARPCVMLSLMGSEWSDWINSSSSCTIRSCYFWLGVGCMRKSLANYWRGPLKCRPSDSRHTDRQPTTTRGELCTYIAGRKRKSKKDVPFYFLVHYVIRSGLGINFPGFITVMRFFFSKECTPYMYRIDKRRRTGEKEQQRPEERFKFSTKQIRLFWKHKSCSCLSAFHQTIYSCASRNVSWCMDVFAG